MPIWFIRFLKPPLKPICTLLYVMFFLSCFNRADALEIILPTEGQKIVIGTTMRVVVKPELGEKIKEVIAGVEDIPYDANLGVFVREYTIPKETAPGEATFYVEALSESGEIITSRARKFIVSLPSGVNLQKIVMRDDQLKLFLFEIGEVEHLRAD